MNTEAEEFAASVDIAIECFIDRIDAAHDLIKVAAPAIASEDSDRVVFHRFIGQLKYLSDEEIGKFLDLFQVAGESDGKDGLRWQSRLLNSV